MYRILSIDGGGSRGVIPATILDRIAQDTGQYPLDLFDLLTGTSTGSIIAIALANRRPTAEVMRLYLEQSAEVFDDTLWDDLIDGFGKRIGADYANKTLKRLLTAVWGQRTLGDVYADYGDRHVLMVPAFALHPQEDGRPVNFRAVFYNSAFVRDKNLKLVDLALRSTAGPTYFPIYQDHIDGGVAVNHPAMAAVAFALNNNEDVLGEHRYPDGRLKGMGRSLADLKVLSLGCGTSNKNFITRSQIGNGNWGEIQWVRYLPDLLTEANIQVSEYYIKQVLPDVNYRRLMPAFDDPAAPDAIRGRVIGIDVKRADWLYAMHDYALAYYNARRDDLLRWLMP